MKAILFKKTRDFAYSINIMDGYWITRDGTLFSTRRKTIRRIKLRPDKDGYLTYNFPNKKTLKIHRLTAQAFIPNPHNKPCVNHKNGIKSDNRIDNLEWVTVQENTQHACDTGLQKPLPGKVVEQLDKEFNVINKYESQGEAARQTGARQPHINSCCKGIRNFAGGYRWRYKAPVGLQL